MDEIQGAIHYNDLVAIVRPQILVIVFQSALVTLLSCSNLHNSDYHLNPLWYLIVSKSMNSALNLSTPVHFKHHGFEKKMGTGGYVEIALFSASQDNIVSAIWCAKPQCSALALTAHYISILSFFFSPEAIKEVHRASC